MTKQKGAKSGAKRAAIKIETGLKKEVDRISRETGRTRVHILNSAIRAYVLSNSK